MNATVDTSLGPIRLDDVAVRSDAIELCPLFPARFAGGEAGILRDRDRNPFLGWQTVATRPSVHRLDDVVLDRTLMVLMRDGRLIAETNYLQSPAQLEGLRLKPESLVRIEAQGVAISCFDHWHSNYYHWIAHTLPTVYAALLGHRQGEATLILPALLPWQRKSLQMIGADAFAWFETQPGAQYSLPQTDYYDYVKGEADFAVSPLSQAAYNRMTACVPAASPLHRRLYIDRSGAANRSVPNEAELATRLAERGYERVRPETMTVREQIALFKAASIVVGQIGAGLANIAFCQPGTMVYELVPDHHRNPCFLALAMQGDLPYWADAFPTGLQVESHVTAWQRDIDVDAVLLRVAELEALLPAERRPPTWTSESPKARLGRISTDAEPLFALAVRHGWDKDRPHHYLIHYAEHFARFRDLPVTLLEIGVGGDADPEQGGASLRMWHDYFPQARIFALGPHAKRSQISDRVCLYQGSQDDAGLLQRMHDAAGGFDIVIDDGNHINSHVIATFQSLFPLLHPGGLYVVEDTQTSYWPSLGGSSTDADAPSTMMGYFKGLVHGLNHAERLGGSPGRFDRDIVSITFHHNLVVIEKGDNSRPSNVPAHSELRRVPVTDVQLLHRLFGRLDNLRKRIFRRRSV